MLFNAPGIKGASMIPILRMVSGAFGIPTWDFDPASVTFDPGMAKRSTSVFSASPIVQGAFDGTGTGDVLSFSRGVQISGHFYETFDGYQWEFGCFWTPEISSGDLTGKVYLLYASSNHYVAYDYDNDRFEVCVGGQTSTGNQAIVSGTRYALIAGGSSIQKYDGTNYCRVSINNTQTFGATTQPTASAPDATIYIGSNNGANACNGIIEGAFIVRELLWDGTYGTDLGNGDVIAAHYAAGVGADVALSIGSWDTTFSLPTNATAGEIVTGTGEAWSHPHSSALLTDTFCETTYGSSAWPTKGTPSAGPSDISAAEQLQGAGGYEFTVDADGEGIEQTLAGLSAGSNYDIRTLAHEDTTNDIRLLIYDVTNGAAISTYLFGSGSDKDAPGVALITFELPTIARNGVGADCTSITISVEGTNAGQTVYVHQVELQTNLIDNPSLETGAGNPWIPDGWTNNLLAIGESSQDLASFHSGLSSILFNNPAAGHSIRFDITLAINKFCGFGYFGKEASGDLRVWDGAGRFKYQANNVNYNSAVNGAAWLHYLAVLRASATSPRTYTGGWSAVPTGNIDDLYAITLDDVSLTVTPASEANSQESGGLRVDGYDNAPATMSIIEAMRGRIRFSFILRHDDGDFLDFGSTAPVLCHAHGDANNYIYVEESAANTIRLRFNDGGGEHSATWATAGALVVGTTYQAIVEWNVSYMILLIDSVEVIRITQPVDFSTVPTTFYPGSSQAGNQQSDGVFLAP